MKLCLLGIIQGLTEFLPVSSSGHLVLAQQFLGVHIPGISLEITLHLATLLAIFVYFNRNLLEIFDFKNQPLKQNLLLLLVVGSIPAGIAGGLGAERIEALFEGIKAPSIFLLLNGLILSTSLLAREKRDDVTIWDALLIGSAQALAILPGISRSGSTITMALLLGLRRERAFRFSFYLSIPAILGASLLDMLKEGWTPNQNYLLPFILSFAFGLFALYLLKNVVLRGKLAYFGIYTALLGLTALILAG
ncbi:MAG: undecaprenyl-diphosphate phosphatase [Candidatus Hydrothermae bacterium]|nr:undecaprenyl-diphosphate phosphatase [Candidatus Hydrothermae bacterium]